MIIHFISTDQFINTKFLCKKSYKFAYIEEILYQKYPKYRNKNNYFLVNGGMVNRNLSLSDNKIQDKDIITLVHQ